MGLCVVQRLIGLSQQLFVGGSVFREQGNADTAGNTVLFLYPDAAALKILMIS